MLFRSGSTAGGNPSARGSPRPKRKKGSRPELPQQSRRPTPPAGSGHPTRKPTLFVFLSFGLPHPSPHPHPMRQGQVVCRKPKTGRVRPGIEIDNFIIDLFDRERKRKCKISFKKLIMSSCYVICIMSIEQKSISFF